MYDNIVTWMHKVDFVSMDVDADFEVWGSVNTLDVLVVL